MFTNILANNELKKTKYHFHKCYVFHYTKLIDFGGKHKFAGTYIGCRFFFFGKYLSLCKHALVIPIRQLRKLQTLAIQRAESNSAGVKNIELGNEDDRAGFQNGKINFENGVVSLGT